MMWSLRAGRAFRGAVRDKLATRVSKWRRTSIASLSMVVPGPRVHRETRLLDLDAERAEQAGAGDHPTLAEQAALANIRVHSRTRMSEAVAQGGNDSAGSSIRR